jgi:hypothetical protein
VSALTSDDPSAYSPPSAFGPFRVLHQIGVGVLGPVFRSYEPARDRLVAVKVFRLDITPEQAHELATELERLVELNLFHPSIVAPVGAGVEGATTYLGAEYVAGESLDVAMRHYAPAPLERALPFITQLAGAIDFARASGIGHGTLHPRDVFVTPDETRATGFGIADALERLGLRAPVRRPYTAPERIAGGEWSTAADVFSLAAIAYELITGRRPAGTGERIAPLPAGAGPDTEAVHRVLARALADDPRARHRSALELAADLQALAGDDTLELVGGSDVDAAFDDEELPLQVGAGTLDSPGRSDEGGEDGEEAGDVQDLREIYLRDGGSLEAEERPVGPSATHLEFDAPLEERASQPERLRGPEALQPGPFAPGELDQPSDFALGPFGHDEVDKRRGEIASSDVDEPVVVGAPDIAADDRDPPSRYHPEGIADPGPVYLEDREDESGRGAVAALPAGRDPGARPRMLPIALALAVGLLGGFLAGYGLGSRQQSAPAAIADELVEGSPRAATDPERVWSEAEVSEPAPGPGARESASPAVAPVVPDEAAQETLAPSPPPAPAPPPPAPDGRLLVRSTPAGARVQVNGAPRGTTPLTLRGLEPGTYTVRVEREGYRAETRRVTISAARPAGSATFTLQPDRPAAPVPFIGALYVDSRPRGARVLLNGSPIGTTPMRISEVSAGAHVVRIEQPGYRPWTASVRVVTGEETRVAASLDPDRRQ